MTCRFPQSGNPDSVALHPGYIIDALKYGAVPATRLARAIVQIPDAVVHRTLTPSLPLGTLCINAMLTDPL